MQNYSKEGVGGGSMLGSLAPVVRADNTKGGIHSIGCGGNV